MLGLLGASMVVVGACLFVTPAHLRIPAAALVVFAALQLVALPAYGNAVAWGSVAATVYVVGLLAVLGAGLVGLRVARPRRP